jgi:two-component system LytT family response regulator
MGIARPSCAAKSEAMLKTLICDDELPALELLAEMLADTMAVDIVASCLSVAEAMRRINEGGIDLAFLDVEMPDMTGVEAARMILVEPKPLLIFATAHPEYAVDAFGIDAIDYILKPFDPARVHRSVEKAVRLRRTIVAGVGNTQPAAEEESRADKSNMLKIRDAARFYMIPLDDIVWIEAAGDYSLIHRSDSQIAIRRTITSLEGELPEARFRRIHRSCIISIEHIEEIRRLSKGEASIMLRGAVIVKASRSYRDVVEQLIS